MEAKLQQTEHGLVPQGDGWFTLNLRSAVWRAAEGRGAFCALEGDHDFDELGFSPFVLQPGDPMSLYHWEADQEAFRVVAGEAVLIVEGEERPLRAWDFVHCPPGRKHVIVGAGGWRGLAVPVGRGCEAGGGRRPRQVGWRKLGRLHGRRDGREARRERRRGHDRAERGVREGRAAGADPQRRRLAPELGSERQQQKAEAFRALHEGEPFVIPNPWDAGSARMLEALGFQALATTSSGFAFTLGKLDGNVTLDELAAHVTALDAATRLPVSGDLENGFDASADAAAATLGRVALAGAVGGSIEDWDPAEERIYDFDHAVERVAAAATVARELDFPFTFTARAENYIHGRDDLDDTIARLQAFEQAGADVLYAPGLKTADEIRAVCEAVTKPVNALAFSNFPFAEIVEEGAQRVSVGGQLTWVALKAAADAAEAMRQGDFSALAARVPLGDWLA